MVERTVDRDDRRNTFVTITESGNATIDRALGEMDSFADAVFSQLGEEKSKQINEYFRQLLEAAEAEIEKRKDKGKEDSANGENI